MYFLVNIPVLKSKEVHFNMKDNVLIILSGLLLALHFAFWISAFEHTTVAGVVIPLLMQPIVIGFFSWLFYGEKVSKNSFVSLLIIFTGIFLMNFWDFKLSISLGLGDLLSIIGTVILCFYFLLAKKFVKEIGALRFNYFTYLIATVFLLTFALLKINQPIFKLNVKELLFYTLLGVVCSFLGYTLVNFSFKHFKALSVSIALVGEPLLGIFWTSILLGEKITSAQFLGLAITIIGFFTYFFQTEAIEKNR